MSANELAVFLATLNKESPIDLSPDWDCPRNVFNSINCLSTSITDLATIEIAWLTAMIPPEVAPNAVTRAVAACNDLVNSATSPVILPSG